MAAGAAGLRGHPPAPGSFLTVVTDVSGTLRAWGTCVTTHLLARQLVLSIAGEVVRDIVDVAELSL